MQGETMSEPIQLVIRLAPEAYTQLLTQLQAKGKPTMTKEPLEAAYMLGMQHVLEKLREGFVIGA
jgi:hypothetical protein